MPENRRVPEFVGGLSQHDATRGELCSHIQWHARGIGHRRDRTQRLHVCRGDPIAVAVENLAALQTSPITSLRRPCGR